MSTALPSVDPEILPLPRLGGLSRRLAALPSLHVGAAVLSVLLGGLLLSMATTSDPLWWQLHFSQLGIFGDFSSALFNSTLKVSGSMVVVFAFFVRRDIRRLGRGRVRRGSATLACVCLNTVGINLALVGCVPLNTDKDLHDRVAAMMVLGFLVLLLSAPVMLRRLGTRMAVSTGVALVWLVLSIALFVTATINLALFETIACGAMFAWSGMLTHTLASVAARTDPHAESGAGRGTHGTPRRTRPTVTGRHLRLPVSGPRRSTPHRTRLAVAIMQPAPAAGERRRSGLRRPTERLRVTRSRFVGVAPRRAPSPDRDHRDRHLVPRRVGTDTGSPRRGLSDGAASSSASPLRWRIALRPSAVSVARGTRDGSPDARRRSPARPRRRSASLDALGAARSPLR